MLDVNLVYLGQGRFTTASKLDLDSANHDLPPNERVRARITRKRSVQQNEFFHALIKAAYDNQRSGQPLSSWRHLKSHLLIRVGHCDEVRIALAEAASAGAMQMVKEMTAALRRRFDTVEVSYDRARHEVVMRFAKSVSFSECSSERMGEIVDQATAIICSEIVPGTTPEQIFGIARGSVR